ncbi:hypothetical protein ACKWTF_015808 [Chironomus riparius]
MHRQVRSSLILLIILFIQSLFCKSDQNFRAETHFNTIKCESNTTVVNFRFWYLKPISRQVVTLNIGSTILLEIHKPRFIQIIINYRYGTIYRQVLDTHPLE